MKLGYPYAIRYGFDPYSSLASLRILASQELRLYNTLYQEIVIPTVK